MKNILVKFMFTSLIALALLLGVDLKVAEAATYPGTSITVKPGDVLYTSKKTTDYLTGHVAIVNDYNRVVHAPGTANPGLESISINSFFSRFHTIDVWRARSSSKGQNAAQYSRTLFYRYGNSDYTVFTPLAGNFYDQYCTKLVWQSYYYGASINLGDISLTKYTVPPTWVLDNDYLRKVANNL